MSILITPPHPLFRPMASKQNSSNNSRQSLSNTATVLSNRQTSHYTGNFRKRKSEEIKNEVRFSIQLIPIIFLYQYPQGNNMNLQSGNLVVACPSPSDFDVQFYCQQFIGSIASVSFILNFIYGYFTSVFSGI